MSNIKKSLKLGVSLLATLLASSHLITPATAQTAYPTGQKILRINNEHEAVALCDYLIKNRDTLVHDPTTFPYKGKTYNRVEFPNQWFRYSLAGGELELSPKYAKKYRIMVADAHLDDLNLKFGQRVKTTISGELPQSQYNFDGLIESLVPLNGTRKINICYFENPQQNIADVITESY